MHQPAHFIQQYQLVPHPEGGWYKENYKSKDLIPMEGLPASFSGPRVFSTAIYFLLEKGNFSAFHTIKSDECWHFYAGGVLDIFILSEGKELKHIQLGNDVAKGQLFQYCVPANTWFASRPAVGTEFSFVGCTVAPGFDFDDFQLADKSQLTNLFPSQASLIAELCR